MPDNIFISKKIWATFDPKRMEEFQSSIFNYYRYEGGFPYLPTDKDYRDKEFQRFWRYDFARSLEGNRIKLTSHGASFLWSYFPHAFSIKSYGRRTPVQIFYDDTLFKVAIAKAIKFGNRISDSRIRSAVSFSSSAKGVANFRSVAAAIAYSLYTKPGDRVLDPCAGFGGRLLGAARVGVDYIGIDPSTKTHIGLKQLANDYCTNINTVILQECAEVYECDANSIDFVLMSPPYFKLEEYAEEATQSYIRYPDKELWLDSFLKKLLVNIFHALKPGKYLAFNIKANKYFPELEKISIELACEVGFERKKDQDLKLMMSSLMGTKHLDHKEERYEPIYLFQKPVG